MYFNIPKQHSMRFKSLTGPPKDNGYGKMTPTPVSKEPLISPYR